MSTQIYESHMTTISKTHSASDYRDFLRKAAEYQLLVQRRREKRVIAWDVAKRKKNRLIKNKSAKIKMKKIMLARKFI